MVLQIDGKKKEAEIYEYRCSDFVSPTLVVDGNVVHMIDTFSELYKVVDAEEREKEMLKGWGYRIDGI